MMRNACIMLLNVMLQKNLSTSPRLQTRIIFSN